MRLAAVSAEAAALGLSPGLTLADAHVRVPQLHAIDMDRNADRAWLEQIADFCDRYTPLVAIESDDTLILDITGCAHLFGGEQAMRNDVMARLTSVAPHLRACIAGTPQSASAQARYGTIDIIAPGENSRAASPLPVSALGIDKEIVIALCRAGLKTVGDLALRPRGPLAARFGPDILDRLARILGEEDIAITPRRAPPPCSVERRFAEPIGNTDDVLGILGHLLGEAAKTLERRGSGGRIFIASFFRVDGHVARIQVETARPARDADAMMRLFQERIDALSHPLDAGFGYDLVRLSVPVIEPLKPAQRSLDGQTVQQDQVIALIDRLGARLGQASVQRLMVCDSHIPERAACAIPAALAPQTIPKLKSESVFQPVPDRLPPRPLHLFAQPQPVETLAEVPDGPPVRFRWRKVLHEVVKAEGPERIAPEWWQSLDPDETGRTRDYFRVEDRHGHRFWLFREGLYGQETRDPRWFLHGLFP
ncbi:MAG: DNA polymerase Y family protein [Pseudomonadota bacterium]